MAVRNLKKFPDFMMNGKNAVKSDDKSGTMSGYAFDGIDGSQMVIWDCPDGGASKKHVHDFDEYALIVSGTYTGIENGKEVIYKAGSECYIPAGEWHEGFYSKGYRAIDAFQKKRVKRVHEN